MSYILYIIFVIFISIAGYKVYIYEKTLKKRLDKLEVKIKNLYVLKNYYSINTEMSIEGQLIYLEQQAEKLKFCFQCPLYQDKDR